MGRSWRTLLAVVSVTVGLVAATATGAQAGSGYFTNQDLTTSGGGATQWSVVAPEWYTPWDRVRHVAYSDAGDITIGSQQSGSSTWTWTTTPTLVHTDSLIHAYAYSWDHSSHIIYTSSDGHLHELWYSEASPAWNDGDLTALTGAPINLVVRSGFEQGGQQHLVASGFVNGHIWEFNFRPAYGWQATDLNTTTGATESGMAVGVGRGDTYGQTIAYIGLDDRVHALTWTTAAGWSDVAVTAPFSPYHGLSIFAATAGDRVTIAYHAATGNVYVPALHMATWTAATGWVDTNVTAATGAPDDFINEGQGVHLQSDGSDRFYQVNQTGQIQEYVQTSDGRWFAWMDTAQGFVYGTVFPSALVFPADNEGWRWTVSVTSIAGNHHLNLMDMTI